MKKLISDLADLYELQSGKKLLYELNFLLKKTDQKLMFSFVKEENESPECIQSLVTICNDREVACKSIISLPKSINDPIELKFYSQKQREIVIVKEPMCIVLGHELIHCVQKLVLCPY